MIFYIVLVLKVLLIALLFKKLISQKVQLLFLEPLGKNSSQSSFHAI